MGEKKNMKTHSSLYKRLILFEKNEIEVVTFNNLAFNVSFNVFFYLWIN